MPVARNEDNESNTEVKEPPKSSCATYVAEGNKLYRKNEFRKAIESYSNALQQAEVEEVDKKLSLYSRALCHLYLGSSEDALRDAEEALEQDSNYIKALQVKADALYAMGDFEYAAVFYHRGNHMRPDCAGFKIGIQKSEEAICNAIGPNGVDLSTEGDLGMYYCRDQTPNYITFTENRNKDKKGGQQRQETKKKDKASKKKDKISDSCSRRLLGEIYPDKKFLEKFHEDEKVGDVNRGIAKDALEYLQKKQQFWLQQNPSSTQTKKQERTRSGRAITTAHLRKNDPGRYMYVQLERTDEDLQQKKYKQVEKRCNECIKEAKAYNENDLSNKLEILATFYSLLGQCHFEQGKYEQAEKQYLKDYDISQQENHFDGKSRALDNLGRVCVKLDNLDKAVEHWESKLQLLQQQPARGATAHSDTSGGRAKTAKDLALERTWLYHEIGRCHLKSSKNSEAKEYGERALASAKQSDDKSWQLNALGLIGKAEAQMEEYQMACDSFEKALEIAKDVENKEAQKALEAARADVNRRMVRGVKTEEAAETADDDDEHHKGGGKGRGRKSSKDSHRDKSPKDKSPKRSPKDKSPKRSPRDKSPKGSPKDKSPKGSPKDKSPKHSPRGGPHDAWPTRPDQKDSPKDKSPKGSPKD